MTTLQISPALALAIVSLSRGTSCTYVAIVAMGLSGARRYAEITFAGRGRIELDSANVSYIPRTDAADRMLAETLLTAADGSTPLASVVAAEPTASLALVAALRKLGIAPSLVRSQAHVA